MPLLPLTKVCNRLIDTTSMLYWMLLSFVRRSSPQLTQLNPEIIPYQFSLSPLRHFNTVRISSLPACYRSIRIPYSFIRFTKTSICFPAFVVSCMVENIFISFASLCFNTTCMPSPYRFSFARFSGPKHDTQSVFVGFSSLLTNLSSSSAS